MNKERSEKEERKRIQVNYQHCWRCWKKSSDEQPERIKAQKRGSPKKACSKRNASKELRCHFESPIKKHSEKKLQTRKHYRSKWAPKGNENNRFRKKGPPRPGSCHSALTESQCFGQKETKSKKNQKVVEYRLILESSMNEEQKGGVRPLG